MIDKTLATAVSGLLLQAQRAGTVAHNAANAVTPGFVSSDVSAVTLATGGVAPVRAEAGAAMDIGREFARLVQTEVAYTANARVIRVADVLLRTTVDLIA